MDWISGGKERDSRVAFEEAWWRSVAMRVEGRNLAVIRMLA